MLKNLHIENYAIIDSLDIDFGQSLNTITGETGAGKSIILGALGLLSGERADSSSIMTGASRCVVEGEFSVVGYGLEGLFAELDLEVDGGEITIRRVIMQGGKSRAYIGEVPVTLQILRAIMGQLIDIHSQHQTLLLARGDFQQRMVDAVGGNLPLFADYSRAYSAWRAKIQELENLRQKVAESQSQQEFLTYQVEQLQEANIQPQEGAQLEAEEKILLNTTDLIQAYSTAQQSLENERGAIESVRTALHSLSRIGEIDANAGELHQRLESCRIELMDISGEVEDKAAEMELNPKRLEAVQQRLDTIYTLCKKHRAADSDALLGVQSELESQLGAIAGGDEQIQELENKAATLHQTALKLAQKLSQKRTQSAAIIEEFTNRNLLELGIQHPKFVVSITENPEPNTRPNTRLSASGIDTVRFLFSANKQSEPKPIEGVASGGEMARLMLCLKSLVSSKIQLPTIIFDEIDTGVSGSVADSMGRLIEGMSQSMQVLNITHLPQVAAKGTDHFEVYKDADGTHIKRLFEGQRIEKIAEMLSGATITDAARAQAKALLNTK